MLDSELAGLNSFEIKEISDFNEATSTGFYAVRGNAFGGPMYNDSTVNRFGCLKVFYHQSSAGRIFKLMEFAINAYGTVYYFMRFIGVEESTGDVWVQVYPAITTSVPVSSPTD